MKSWFSQRRYPQKLIETDKSKTRIFWIILERLVSQRFLLDIRVHFKMFLITTTQTLSLLTSHLKNIFHFLDLNEKLSENKFPTDFVF